MKKLPIDDDFSVESIEEFISEIEVNVAEYKAGEHFLLMVYYVEKNNFMVFYQKSGCDPVIHEDLDTKKAFEEFQERVSKIKEEFKLLNCGNCHNCQSRFIKGFNKNHEEIIICDYICSLSGIRIKIPHEYSCENHRKIKP